MRLVWILAASLSWPGVAAAQEGGWRVVAPTGDPDQIGFSGGAGASDGAYLYHFGGRDLSGRETRRYDPAADSWSTLAPMPRATTYNAGVYFPGTGTIYSFGNYLTYVGTIDAYSVAADAWTTLAPRVPNLATATACCLGSKIYILGNIDYGSAGLATEFDPVNLTVVARPRCPLPLVSAASAGSEATKRVYAFGGFNRNSVPVADTYEFNPADGSWRAVAPMNIDGTPRPMAWHAAVSIPGGRIYVIGDATLEFAPEFDLWNARPHLSVTRSQSAVGAVRGRIYDYGGVIYSTQAPVYVRNLDEFTPPDPVPGPLDAAPRQIGPAGVLAPGGVTNGRITFEAEIRHDEPLLAVRLDVQVKPVSVVAWDGVATHTSGFGPQGLHTVTMDLPAEGPYDWRYRFADRQGRTTPIAGWTDYHPSTPDFIADTSAPSAPVALSPSGRIPLGTVDLTWRAASDLSAIDYEIEVAYDPGFASPFLTGRTASDRWAADLPDEFVLMHWRVRAVDPAGNASAWSAPLTFQFRDPRDHAAGDAVRWCGFSAPAVGRWSAVPGLLAVLALGPSFRRRGRARNPA